MKRPSKKLMKARNQGGLSSELNIDGLQAQDGSLQNLDRLAVKGWGPKNWREGGHAAMEVGCGRRAAGSCHAG